MNALQPLTNLDLIGRQAEFQRIVQVLARDGDLLITGVPGSGRRTLVRRAAQEVGAWVLEVDCIRVTDGERFVHLLCESLDQTFRSEPAQALIRGWVEKTAADWLVLTVDAKGEQRLRPVRGLARDQLWNAFEALIQLPQILAEFLNGQVVLSLPSFPHIRSWDRNREWETFLRQEIQRQTRVSYVLVATIAEISSQPDEALESLQLNPLPDEVLAAWVQKVFAAQGLTFDPLDQALDLFLTAVQGHLGDALALARRLHSLQVPKGLIGRQQVEQALQGLLADLSAIFESLLLLLPASQVQLLECLATDPTDKPQSREYIHKHCLSRGGSLQGALAGLQQKGLLYGSDQGYRLALPLLALWIRERLI
ncbi:ATP-binding protein [Leptolyngbya sp. FACHB-261]|nr:ATP-binding protein [Leptolyngbya sp. FACHB-261]